MGSSSTTTGSITRMQNSGNSDDQEEELQAEAMRRRKQKRMQSNRESARRSRMRKQKHLDELAAQASCLAGENGRLLTAVGFAAQQVLAVEAENSLLRAQCAELGSRLCSLDQILMGCVNGVDESRMMMMMMMMRPMIMASEDMVQLQYC